MLCHFITSITFLAKAICLVTRYCASVWLNAFKHCILINWHPFIPHATVGTALVKVIPCTFICQCLKVLVWPSTRRNDMSPSDNGVSSHSLRLFHHLIASFFFPSPVAVIVIPAVRTEGGLADISSSMDTDWPVVFTVGIFVTPSSFGLHCLREQIVIICKWDCTSTHTSNESQVWQ